MPDVLTKNELAIIDEAKVLAEKIRGRAKLTEELRRIPEETIQELKDTGIIKILRPKRYGGLQLSVETYARVIVEISKACASTGWIASLCAIRELMVAESFTEEAHEEIFGQNPEEVLFAGVYEPRECIVQKVDGGYLIEKGHWMFCSGSLHATWGYFGMYTKDGDGNILEQLLMTVPFSELEIDDDWYTLGLKGTGSNAVRMRNVFVPDNRVTSFIAVLDGNFKSTHLRDIPLYSAASISCINSFVRLTSARGCARNVGKL